MPTKSDLPPFVEYFVPSVHCIKARGGSTTIEEMEEDVGTAMKLPDELLAVPHGDGPATVISRSAMRLSWNKCAASFSRLRLVRPLSIRLSMIARRRSMSCNSI